LVTYSTPSFQYARQNYSDGTDHPDHAQQVTNMKNHKGHNDALCVLRAFLLCFVSIHFFSNFYGTTSCYRIL